MNEVEQLKQIETTLHELFAKCGDAPKWTWDSYYKTAVSAISIVEVGTVQNAISNEMTNSWHVANLKESPNEVTKLVENLSGLHRGQNLYTSTIVKGTLLFAAFWPWSDGTTVSIRIGLFRFDSTLDSDECEKKLKASFQL